MSTYIYNKCISCGKKVRMQRPQDERIARIAMEASEVYCNRCFSQSNWRRLEDISLRELIDMSTFCSRYGQEVNLGDNCFYCIHSKGCKEIAKILQ